MIIYGYKITIKAQEVDGKVFDKWVFEIGNVEIQDVNSSTTTFTMKDSDVKIKATYKDASSITPTDPSTPTDHSITPTDPSTNPTTTPKGLSGGAIVEIVIGSLFILSLGGFAIFWFVIKKKSFADFVAVFKKK